MLVKEPSPDGPEMARAQLRDCERRELKEGINNNSELQKRQAENPV